MPDGVGAFFFAECDSTNALAGSLARKGEAGPIWVCAGVQTAGRGRRGRIWTSEPGNLYTSLMFRPNLKPTELSALPFIVALAIRDTFIALGADPERTRCKWPNDVLLDEKKASGVLIESSARNAETLDYVVVGIGMNLLHFPHEAVFEATSLKDAFGKLVQPRDALPILAGNMVDRLNNWNIYSFTSIAQEWINVSWGLGQRREIRTATETFVGVLESLSNDGGIIVRLDDGTEKRLYAGDIFPVDRSE
ncbi:MAG: biotin--[acetyl-CoA-carboxylase] ligase [Alphaproteobacteria bacterium]|nr:biotin--[acetyl-CoA-carboxylase] ligase [Alphaproteobacteria bacterium]